MGVHGLWKLLDPVGKPIPVETLENQVIAVDVSIWLHQLMKGFQDSTGSSIPNAHLVGLFHRICKLLFFRIKPVFVFDGGVPTLKKKTIANRNQQKDRAAIASEKARQQLLKNLLKQRAVGQVLEDLKAKSGTFSSSQRQPDLYELPPITEEIENSEDSDDIKEYASSSEDDYKKKKKYKDLHTIDVKSAEFKALPADIRHDILTDLKETRKQNSWGRIHELPEEMDGFSSYQMGRLLKRRSVQVSLEEAEKEMGGHTLSLGDIEALLTEQGVDTAPTVGRRIASDNVTRYVYANELTREGKKPNEKAKDTNIQDGKGKSKESVNWEDEEEIYIIDDEIICMGDIKIKTEKDEDKTEEIMEGVSEAQNSTRKQIKVEEESDSSESAIFEDIVKEEMELRKRFATDDMGISQEQIMLLIKEQKDKPRTTVEMESEISPSTSKELVEKRSVEKSDEDDRFEDEHAIDVKTERLGEKTESFERENRIEKEKVSEVAVRECLGSTPEEDKNARHTSQKVNLSNSNIPSKFYDNKHENLDPKKNSTPSSFTQNSSSVAEISDWNETNVSSEKDEDAQKMTKDRPEPYQKTGEIDDETSKTEESSLEITVSTKKNSNVVEEDIFADIFSNDSHNSGENIESMLEKEGKQGNKDVELMSSDSSSVEEVEAISGDDSSSVEGEEVESGEEANQREKKESNEPHSSQYFKSDSVETTGTSPETTAENEKLINEDKSNEMKGDSQTESNEQEEKKKRTLSTKELRGLQNILEKQEVELMQVQGREERLASTVTEQMRLEAEELLQLFGLPWIKAPMEAEAQCAFLDLIGLTQGTITDDSDIWLFGAHRVYKNFFNQKKYVLQFRSDDIKSFFKLSRGDLIELALLVGSDYTVGINGVGPVTALEIISTFRPANSNGESILATLQAFKQWLQHPSNSKSSPLARKLKDVELDDGFPSKDVVDAYLKPCVDDSEEAFSWSDPDVDGLKAYANRKFGWSQAKVDELLIPVMNSLNKKASQTRIDSFFNMRPAIPQHNDKVSRRVQRAVERMGGGEEGAGEEGASRGRDLLAEESLPSTSTDMPPRSRAPRGKRNVTQRGGRGGIRDEIRVATMKDRFRSRQPRTRVRPTPLVANPEPSGTPRGRSIPSKDSQEELIPQRERDRLEGLKRKIEAIKVVKSKKGKKLSRAPIKRTANLSESSSDSD